MARRAPPAAPQLNATFDNVYKIPKMYTKWCRQVEAWKLRVRHYKPFAEATLDLVDAVSGYGALMLEKVPLSELHTPAGVDKVVDMMKVFDEVALHSIGNVLESWETIRRTEGCTLSKFIGDFLDLERECKAKGLEVQSGDARAYKFLRACAMTPDHQRQLLVESRGYDFDRLCAAMRMQWPRQAPPIARGDQTRSPFHSRSSSLSGKSFGRDRPRHSGSSASSVSSRPSHGSRVHEAAQDDWQDDGWSEWWPETVPEEDTVWQAESQDASWSDTAAWPDAAWQDQAWQPETETTAGSDFMGDLTAGNEWAEVLEAAGQSQDWQADWQLEGGEHVLEAALSEIAECYSVTATKLKGITLVVAGTRQAATRVAASPAAKAAKVAKAEKPRAKARTKAGKVSLRHRLPLQTCFLASFTLARRRAKAKAKTRASLSVVSVFPPRMSPTTRLATLRPLPCQTLLPRALGQLPDKKATRP